MKTLVLLFLLPIFVQPWAQSHIVFSPISSTHGLSENRVRTICQLADGRMVIVTEGLVNIYDGASFEYMHYNEQKAYHLRDYSGYHRAYVDNEHRLWIKNRHQVMLFDFRAARFEPAIDSVFAAQGINSNIVDLFMDSDFNFWYVLENKTLLLRENSTRNTRTFIHNVQKVSLSPNDRLYDLAIRDNQLFLFFQSGEMVCYNIETAQELYRETTLHEPLNRYSNTLMVVPHKQFLYQARSGNNTGLLVRFNTLNRKWERLLETDYWLNTLTVDNLGNCWIGSFAGLWKIDGALMKKQLVSPLHLVDGRVFNCEISTQFNDSQGGLWLGTVNRGMLYYHPNRFKFRNFGPSMFNVDNNKTVYVNSLIGYDDGILIGTSSGLYQFANNRQELILTNRVPATTNCRMMLKDSRNRLWICAQSNELYCIDGQRTRYYKTTEQCNFLFETFDGRMIVCTNSGPGIFDTTNGHIEKARPTSANTLGNTFQLVDYRQDTLLGYSTNGLFFYDINNNTVSFPKKDSPLLHHNNQHYHCLFTDSRGLIWIGTGDGLNVFDTKTQSTQSFHHKDGLVNNSIRSIIEDHLGRIWVSTSNGISCIEQSSTESAYRFTNYNHLDGVIENEFLPQSVTKTNDGRLLWGGLDGLNELDLNQLGSSTPQLSIPLFSRFFLSGTEIKMGKVYDGNIILKQSITTTQEIRLKHHQNFFSVEFSALNYVNPAQTHYRYLLEGVDTYWRETTTRDGIGRSNYTNLSPGTYRLKVQATTNNQQWDQRFAQLTIVIVPPFWKTMWAYAAYFMVILELAIGRCPIFIQQNRKKTQKRQKEELDQLKFKFFTNISHELRTPLTLIITPLDSIIKKLTDQPLKSTTIGCCS
jgi:ligand-binding sensor domain-containing protein